MNYTKTSQETNPKTIHRTRSFCPHVHAFVVVSAKLATAVFRLKPMNVLWATQISILFLRVLISSASVGQQQGNVVLFRCTSSICDHASLF